MKASDPGAFDRPGFPAMWAALRFLTISQIERQREDGPPRAERYYTARRLCEGFVDASMALDPTPTRTP